MESFSIVPDFDELKDHRTGVVIFTNFTREIHFSFQFFKEAFRRGITSAVSLYAYSLGDVRVLVQKAGKRFTGILDAKIRMKQQLTSYRSFCASLIKSGHTGV
jgi:hypothetical protein